MDDSSGNDGVHVRSLELVFSLRPHKLDKRDRSKERSLMVENLEVRVSRVSEVYERWRYR